MQGTSRGLIGDKFSIFHSLKFGPVSSSHIQPKLLAFAVCLAFALVPCFWMRAHLAGIERKRASPWRKPPPNEIKFLTSAQSVQTSALCLASGTWS